MKRPATLLDLKENTAAQYQELKGRISENTTENSTPATLEELKRGIESLFQACSVSREKRKTEDNLQTDLERLRIALADEEEKTKELMKRETDLGRASIELSSQLRQAIVDEEEVERRTASLKGEMEKLVTEKNEVAKKLANTEQARKRKLQLSRRPAEYIASESRSRFTATLPPALQDEGSLLDDDFEEITNSPVNVEITPRPKRKKLKNLGSRPITLERPASSRGMAEPISLRGPETKKRRRTGAARKVNNPSNDSDKSLADSSTPSGDAPDAIPIPRRKHGKATRKTTGSSPAKKRQEEQEKDVSSTEPPRRTLRSRGPISYNDDEQRTDLVSTQDGFDVDFEALQPVQIRGRERNA